MNLIFISNNISYWLYKFNIEEELNFPFQIHYLLLLAKYIKKILHNILKIKKMPEGI